MTSIPGFRIRLSVGMALLGILVFDPIRAEPKDGPLRNLSGGERAAIVLGSTGAGIAARLIPDRPSNPQSYAGYRANALDRWWRKRINGIDGYQTNIVDHKIGSLIAPVAGGLTMAAIDINRHEFSRDLPYFIAGSVMTGALTTSVKKSFRRPRPYTQDGGVMPPGLAPDDSYHTESFFSGHSSQAFFAAGFVNNRLRRHMRQEWRRHEYRSWRWASPLITFGWAGFVGWSRMHADKHHFTDVVTAAVVGYAISEVYYRLAYSPGDTKPQTIGSNVPMIQVRLLF